VPTNHGNPLYPYGAGLQGAWPSLSFELSTNPAATRLTTLSHALEDTKPQSKIQSSNLTARRAPSANAA